MRKKVKVISIIFYILLSLVVITVGLFVADALPQKLSYKINSFFSNIDIPVKSDEVINDAIHPVAVEKEDEKNSLPEDMMAMWLELDHDVTADPANGINGYLNEMVLYYDYFENFHANAVFIKPDTGNKYASLTDAAGNHADLLREYLNYAATRSYTSFLILDDDLIFDAEGNLCFDNAKYYLSNYTFGGVLLYSEKLTADASLASGLTYFSQAIGSFDKKLLFGTVLTSVEGNGYADQQSIDILSTGYCDYILIKTSGSTISSVLPFGKVTSWWNDFASNYGSTSFYVFHRADLVGGNTPGWGSTAELQSELRCMWDYNNILGSVFHNASAMRSNIGSFAQHAASLIEDGGKDGLKIQKISLDSETNTVTFSGTSLTGHRLLCNRMIAKETGGFFSIKYPLAAGNNSFTFSSCGKELTYRVFNNSHLISAYYPQTDINAAKDDVITITAVCMTGSQVLCTLNGVDYEMRLQENVTLDGMPEGFSVYECGISFTGSSYNDINLGNIVITATLGADKEAVICGRVTLLKSNTSPALNKFLEFVYKVFFHESSKNSQYKELSTHTDDFSISPYHDNGLGTSLMCRIVHDDTEQLGATGAYDTYQPALSALCEGTLDYIDNMTVSPEGYIRYELRSGISVYGVNCELINNAFTMPANKIKVSSVTETVSSTDLVFDTDWLVPVTVKESPLSYRKGYLNYSFNVDSYNAEYVDVIFHHTDTFYNQAKLNFSSDSPFSRTELYSSSNGEIILRLYLRQKGQFYGFDIHKDDESHVIVSFKKHSNGSIAGKVIMLDPGHGGLAMTGTALSDESVCEAKVTLKIAEKAKQMLEAQGATVLLTRTLDTALDLDERCEILSRYNPDVFVSIHCDGSDNESDSGTHTFYFRSYSQPLASAISTSLVSSYSNYIYRPGDTNYASINRGIKFYPFYVTRLNQCPAVLVETGFMTNFVEGSILANDNAQYWIAQGIANGIMNYFTANNATVTG